MVEADRVALTYTEQQDLSPVLYVENIREAWYINSGTGRIEICFDNLRYTNVDQTQHAEAYELELELKHGDKTFLWEITQVLSAEQELIPNFQSKYEHGIALLNVFGNTK